MVSPSGVMSIYDESSSSGVAQVENGDVPLLSPNMTTPP